MTTDNTEPTRTSAHVLQLKGLGDLKFAKGAWHIKLPVAAWLLFACPTCDGWFSCSGATVAERAVSTLRPLKSSAASASLKTERMGTRAVMWQRSHVAELGGGE